MEHIPDGGEAYEENTGAGWQPSGFMHKVFRPFQNACVYDRILR